MMARYSEYDPGGRDLDRQRNDETYRAQDDPTRYVNDDDGTYVSYRDLQAKAEGRRELPPVRREPSPSLYDALRARDDTLELTEQELLDLVTERARTYAMGDPARAAALNRVAARIAQHQEDWNRLSHRDQLDAWDQLLTHETAPARRRDGLIDGFSMEAQALAAAGRGSLDLTQHPELRLRGRDVRSELEQEKNGQRRDQ